MFNFIEKISLDYTFLEKDLEVSIFFYYFAHVFVKDNSTINIFI
jgi:hypothetical protein